MKKIKYGKRREEAEHPELDTLKQDDEICEGVLDTLSDDYLNYITHLVKHSKNTHTNHPNRNKQQPSSDSQPVQPQNLAHPPLHPPFPPPLQDNRTRHHSQTGPKRMHCVPSKDPGVVAKLREEEQSLSNKLECGKTGSKKEREGSGWEQKKKKKRDYPLQQFSIQNQQKTMSFSRNFHNPFLAKPEKFKAAKPREGPKLKQKYYTNYQQFSQSSNERISITDNLLQNPASQRETINYPFISQIDNYLSHLQAKPRKKAEDNRKVKDRYLDCSGFLRSKGEEEERQMESILKENVKLKKKVKGYQKKIEEIEDELSTYLVKSKNKNQKYEAKIEGLIRALTQASAKINTQKQEISTLKKLFKSFGQQVRQIQYQDDDSSFLEEDISDSIIRQLAPQRHSSDIRTKYKRSLESTMPRHEEDSRFWRD